MTTTHQLTWRHNGALDTARCACGAVLRVEDLPHAPPPTILEEMLAYLDARGIPKKTT